MSAAEFCLNITGELDDGVDLAIVKKSIANLLGLQNEHLARIFDAGEGLALEGLDATEAQRYSQALSAIGARHTVKPCEDGGELSAATPAAVATDATSSSPLAVPAADSADRASSERKDYAFSFTGQAGEWFKIWIVNTMLSIITLGIYSAWAKVRKNRYFYSNTSVADSHFSYHGDPIQILKGRMIAGVLLLIYVAGVQFYPGVADLIFFGVFMLIFPFFLVRALRFRMSITRYRNIRFGFDGTVGEAYKYFLLYPLLVMFTFGLLMPWMIAKQKGWMIDRTRFGTSHFEFSGVWQDFWKIYLKAFAILIIGFMVGGLLSALFPPIGAIAVMFVYLLVFVFVTVSEANLIYNMSGIEKHGLTSTLKVSEWLGLQITNGLAILLTAGLALPWTQIRMARYKANHLVLNANGDLDSFVADQQKQASALGEELGDVFDVEVGI